MDQVHGPFAHMMLIALWWGGGGGGAVGGGRGLGIYLTVTRNEVE